MKLYTKEKVKIGLAFWGGLGLMSLINALRLQNGYPILYNWIMFGVSIIFIIICLILINNKK